MNAEERVKRIEAICALLGQGVSYIDNSSRTVEFWDFVDTEHPIFLGSIFFEIA